MNWAKRIEGELEGADGSLQPVDAFVSVAAPTPGQRDFGCRIRCRSLFPDDKTIFGVDEGQAAELALEFIRMLFEAKGIHLRRVGDAESGGEIR